MSPAMRVRLKVSCCLRSSFSNAQSRTFSGTIENLSYGNIRAAEREMLSVENLAALRGGRLVCLLCHQNKVKELKQRQQQAVPSNV